MTDDEAMELLESSESLPNIVRDDNFWTSLENTNPSERPALVHARFLEALSPDELPVVVKAWAGIAAIASALVERLGPLGARERLKAKAH